MSDEELLAAILDSRALDPMPRADSLGTLHIPFDELIGDDVVEAPLRTALERRSRIALIGMSGSGKSSVIAQVLGPMEEGVAPIRVSVSVERPEVATDPRAFLQHLLDTLVRMLAASKDLGRGQVQNLRRSGTTNASTESRRRTFSIGLSAQWIGGLSAQLQPILDTDQRERSAAEIAEVVDSVFEIVASNGLQPIVVINDSDAWAGDSDPGAHLVRTTGFFGPVLRCLVERPCALVLAVHQDYLRTPSFQETQGLIEQQIRIPPLPDEERVEMLLTERVRRCGVTDQLQAWLPPEVSRSLFAYYNSEARGNIRKLLNIVQSAMRHAVDQGGSVVTNADVEVARAEWK